MPLSPSSRNVMRAQRLITVRNHEYSWRSPISSRRSRQLVRTRYEFITGRRLRVVPRLNGERATTRRDSTRGTCARARPSERTNERRRRCCPSKIRLHVRRRRKRTDLPFRESDSGKRLSQVVSSSRFGAPDLRGLIRSARDALSPSARKRRRLTRA